MQGEGTGETHTHSLWSERDERKSPGNAKMCRMLRVQVFLLGQHRGAGRALSLRASALEQEQAARGLCLLSSVKTLAHSVVEIAVY